MYCNHIVEELEKINEELKSFHEQNERFYYEMLGRSFHKFLTSDSTWLGMFFNKKP